MQLVAVCMGHSQLITIFILFVSFLLICRKTTRKSAVLRHCVLEGGKPQIFDVYFHILLNSEHVARYGRSSSIGRYSR